MGGLVYLLSQVGLAWAIHQHWIFLTDKFWLIPIQYLIWTGQVVWVTLTMSLASYFLLDRPLKKLQETMFKAERGDFLIRAPIVGDAEVATLAKNFNRMLTKITDLSALKIQTEHDLLSAHEELRYKKSIEEKNKVIEETNRQLEELVRDLSLIYDIGQGINQTVDLDSLYAVVTDVIRNRLMLHNYSLMAWDEKYRVLRVRAAFGFSNPEKVMQMTFQAGEGIAGHVVSTGKMIYVKDCLKEPRLVDKGVALAGSILSLPLQYKSQALGVIHFGRNEIDGFGAQDIRMLKLVADQVALAMANAKLYTKTRELSLTDELTGVYNRRHFQEVLQLEWKRAVRFKRELSVLMIDIDYFKKFNDTYGHLAGDQVLRQIGFLLKNSLREVDTVARFGGEEFVVMLPDTDKRGALAVAEKLRHLVQEHRFVGEKKTLQAITISVGVACYPHDADEMDDLIDHADIVLYEAKDGGRNRVVVYNKLPEKMEEENTVVPVESETDPAIVKPRIVH